MADLATQRLRLRPVAREDFARIATLAGDIRVAEMTRSIPYPLTVERVGTWFDGSAARREQTFVICRKDEDALIGAVGLTLAAEGGKAEIGYWLAHEFWGQGYMTEAVRRVLRYAFGDLKLTLVEASVLPENARSVGVLVKAGFDVEGRTTRPAPGRGAEREILLFKATRASFARAALSQAVGRE